MKPKGLSLARLVASLFVALAISGTASSQCTTAGCLDATFGPAANGEVLTNLTGYTAQTLPRLVVVPLPQSGGGILYKIGAALSAYPSSTATSAVFGAARYNLDGTLDPTFNGTGIAMTNVSGFPFSATAQPDGKILVVGNGPLVVRFNIDGTLDTAFGSGGVVQVPVPRRTSVTTYAVAVQDDGKIILAGDYGGIMTAWRYTAAGSPDTSFGTGGKASMNFTNSAGSRAFAIALQYIGAEQRIVLGGFVNQPSKRNSSNDNFALARLTSSGQQDSSFGNSGTVVQDSGLGTDVVYGVAIDANNNIIMGGDAGNKAFAVSRYLPNGTLDPSFGSGGTTDWQISNTSAYLQTLTLQADGRILAAGWVSPSGVNNMAVIRLNPDGSLDTTFGTNGVVTNNFAASGETSAVAYGLVVQPGDGKIVIGGPVYLSNVSKIGLARYYP